MRLLLTAACLSLTVATLGCSKSASSTPANNQAAQTSDRPAITKPNPTQESTQETTIAQADRSEQSQSATVTPESNSPQNKASQKVEDFIPQSWQIEKEVSGDLNNDGQADRVIQISEVGDSWERKRSLLIFQATPSGWQQIATAPKLLLCGSCAGSLGGPKGEHIRLSIEDGVLIVNQLSGSRSAIAMTHRFWIDQTSQKMVLIGEDLKPYDRANGNEIIDSRNFLTGKRIVEEYQGQGNGQKKLIRTQALTFLPEARSIDLFDIEIARDSAPKLPD